MSRRVRPFGTASDRKKYRPRPPQPYPPASRRGSVGSAARDLQMSQPSSSQRLARLEQLVGVRLFGVVPTLRRCTRPIWSRCFRRCRSRVRDVRRRARRLPGERVVDAPFRHRPTISVVSGQNLARPIANALGDLRRALGLRPIRRRKRWSSVT
ncbi:MULTISPECIES: LysR family transcriptional regulator [Kribbella]|uniref:helix-turn-helix domain-containing protein n=1 Tax=Kribbella TaxID=182639 RepID=UPI001047F7EE|nr:MULTISPECIES: LysR family transcriptional regulator [Kribbella]